MQHWEGILIFIHTFHMPSLRPYVCSSIFKHWKAYCKCYVHTPLNTNLNGGFHNALGVPELNINERTIQKSWIRLFLQLPRPRGCSDVVFGHNAATLQKKTAELLSSLQRNVFKLVASLLLVVSYQHSGRHFFLHQLGLVC